MKRLIPLLLPILFPVGLWAQQSGPRVAVLYEKDFPSVDGLGLSKESIQKALTGFRLTFLSVSEMTSALGPQEFDLLITPYGSAFPKEAATRLFSFLRGGGHWLNLGGSPLAVPIVREHRTWKRESRQAAYHKQLGITQSFPVAESSLKYSSNPEFDGADRLLNEFTADETFELYLRFTSTRDFPDEDGTAGQRDAVLQPLVWGSREDGTKMTAPLLVLDRLRGEFAGGRWVFANFQGTISQEGIRILTNMALRPVLQLTVQPSLACYRDGEIPSVFVQLHSPAADVKSVQRDDCQITISDSSGQQIGHAVVSLSGTGIIATSTLSVPTIYPLTPGLYQVRAEQTMHNPGNGETFVVSSTNGFWIFDKNLLEGGEGFAHDGTYLTRHGMPYPVTGTTSMASDVARKFLFEPNPSVWNDDMAAMKRAGINMIRTGLWTAWKNVMLDAGTVNETVLRSLDAFLLTARKHDIPVIFTFFAFIPESWGGVNAYLDPRSVSAQQQLLARIAQRYRGMNDLVWDLINEPSFCNPKALWSCRPNYDSFEAAAWNEWLMKRYSLSQLQERWRMTTEESITLPRFEEFSDVNIFDDRRPLKVVDYRLFAQDMFRDWIGKMTSALRSNGNTIQMITVGQDEGGTNDSPNNQFMGDVLSFTSLHNWWLNDDLVWDNVITRMPGVPNLVEETGVMFYENMDGTAWRTEQEAARLLERKLAVSLGAAGAGFIEWIWTINPFMKSDNEATIGLLRVDGTVKPEYFPVSAYAHFFRQNRDRMKNRAEEEIVVVIPHASMFSVRNFATEATKRSIRVLSHYKGMPVAAVSEYGLARLNRIPKLLLVPSPRVLSEQAWTHVMKLATGGSTLLISGPFDQNEHWLSANRFRQLGLSGEQRSVAQEEILLLDGISHRLSYRHLKLQRLEKVSTGSMAEVLVKPLGKGEMIWSPLPIENADNIGPTVAFYDFALRRAGLTPPGVLESGQPSLFLLPLVFEDAVFFACISETDRDISTKLIHAETGVSIPITVPAQRTLLLFVDRKTGKILSQLN